MASTKTRPSVSYSFVMRLTYPNRIGMFARLTHAIGRQGGDLGAVDIVNPGRQAHDARYHGAGARP